MIKAIRLTKGSRMMNSWKEHYWYTVPCMRARIEQTVKAVSGSGKTVLEIGCNEGFLSKALVEDGCIVTSADYSLDQIKKAKEIFNIDAVQADINNIPFPDQSFDIAVSGETLEHVFNPMGALKELFRVARERVVITIPVGEYWLGELTHQWEINAKTIHHDSAEVVDLPKNILILSWTRRRDGSFVDIPPFSTQDLKAKYNIS